MSSDEVVETDDLELGAIAAEQLEALRIADEAAAADPGGHSMPNFRRTVYQMFRNSILRALHLPHVALRPNTLLEDRGATDLRGVRRAWVGAGGRIF